MLTSTQTTISMIFLYWSGFVFLLAKSNQPIQNPTPPPAPTPPPCQFFSEEDIHIENGWASVTSRVYIKWDPDDLAVDVIPLPSDANKITVQAETYGTSAINKDYGYTQTYNEELKRLQIDLFKVNDDMKSSSLPQNSISFLSHICLLAFATFLIRQGGSPLLWSLAMASAYASICRGQVRLVIKIPYEYKFKSKDDTSRGFYEIYLEPNHSTFSYENNWGRVTSSPWPFKYQKGKDCLGNIKSECSGESYCTVDPSNDNLDFVCSNSNDWQNFIGASDVNFGYTIEGSPKVETLYNVSKYEEQNCGGPLEPMGNCQAGFYCTNGKCQKTARKQGKDGYTSADKQDFYCGGNVGETTWEYYFSLNEVVTDELDGTQRNTFQINGTIPGPPIYACVGDTIEVQVTSNLVSVGTTIHWHGLWQRFNQYQDGAGFITQCPIRPSTKWVYRFKAEPGGNTWYHGQTGLQYGDGLFGPITIFKRKGNTECRQVDTVFSSKTEGLIWAQWKNAWCNAYKDEYTNQLDTLFISDWFHKMSYEMFQETFFGTVNISGGPTGDHPWVSGLMNGKGKHNDPHIVNVPQSGETYRMAVINSGQMFGLRFSIDDHDMTIIAQDGMFVEKLVVQQFVLYPGQRIDFLVNMNQPKTQNYWIRARTFPQQNWKWDDDMNSQWHGSFIPGQWRENAEEILGILQYPSGENPPRDNFAETFMTDNTPINNYVTINNPNVQSVYDPGMFAKYAAPTVQHYRLKSYYQYEAFSMSESQSRTIYINGIKFPNYQLALNLKEGIKDISQMNIPVVFAPPHVPVSVTKGQWGLRNLQLRHGFQKVSPQEFKVGNYTQMTYLQRNVPNLLYIANPTPMTQSLHLHGHSFALLASNRSTLKYAQDFAANEQGTCCREIDNPTKKEHSGAEYFDYWAKRWDYSTTPQSNSDSSQSSLLIPGISQRFVDNPVVEDPYGIGDVQLKNPMLQDTVIVPPHGWALIQFFSNNPGAWLFRSHMDFHAQGGMGFVYLVDPDSWDQIYSTSRTFPNLDGIGTIYGFVGENYGCQDVEYLGPERYWRNPVPDSTHSTHET